MTSQQASVVRAFLELRHDSWTSRRLTELSKFLHVARLGLPDSELDLDSLEVVYDDVHRIAEAFPFHARLALPILLSLEDLGCRRDLGAAVVSWFADSIWSQAELTDVGRLEILCILERRGRADRHSRQDLERRAWGSIGHADLYLRPNRQLVSNLTELVMLTSTIGSPVRRAPVVLTCLRRAGCVAYLNGSMGLLGRVCVALELCGAASPDLWRRELNEDLEAVVSSSVADPADDCDRWLIANWLAFLVDASHEWDGRGPFFYARPHLESSLVELDSLVELRGRKPWSLGLSDLSDAGARRVKSILAALPEDADDVLSATTRNALVY